MESSRFIPNEQNLKQFVDGHIKNIDNDLLQSDIFSKINTCMKFPIRI
jgi:hypothetical protein